MNPPIASAAEVQAEARDEARLVTRAFGRLPARWRAVLWQLEVEGKAPGGGGPDVRFVGERGFRAGHAGQGRAEAGVPRGACRRKYSGRLPCLCGRIRRRGSRSLGQRRRAAMQERLGHCPACQDLFTELTELNSRLGAILTPVALAAASSALGSAKRTAHLRRLTGHWRMWRWHPVTTVSGAAAGVAVAGGMLLAVNVTPFPGTPAHAAAGPAAPAAVFSGSSVHKREPGRGSAGGSAASTAAHVAPHSSTGPGRGHRPIGSGRHRPIGSGRHQSTGAHDLAARIDRRCPARRLRTHPPQPGATQTSQPPATGGNPTTPANPSQPLTTVTNLTETAGTAVTGLVNTAGTRSRPS